MNMKRFILTLPICAFLALAFTASTAEAKRKVKNWPCESSLTEDISAEAVWSPPPALDPSWQEDEGVRTVVQYAVNPENPPSGGRDAIAEYAATLGPDKDKKLVQIFTGILEEMNTFHDIIVAGIRNFIIKAKVLESMVEENDAELNDPNVDEKRKADVKEARFWNFANMDDAEEEAEFLCTRYDYVEKKLSKLTEQIRSEMTNK